MTNTNNDASAPTLKAEEAVAKKNLSFGHEILERASKLRKKNDTLKVNASFGDRHIEVEVTDDYNGLLRTLLQIKINRAMADELTASGWNYTEQYICSLMEDAADYVTHR